MKKHVAFFMRHVKFILSKRNGNQATLNRQKKIK